MKRVALCKCVVVVEEEENEQLSALPPKKKRNKLEDRAAKASKKPSAPAASAGGRCEECFRKVCICDAEEPSPSPIRAKPASKASAKAPETYNQGGNDILGIGGGGSDDEEMERDETDSGFAQWDRVKHTKRGLGRVIGFFGEFVMVQFDDEPQGRHKYTWDQAKRKVTIIGWEPPNKQA